MTDITKIVEELKLERDKLRKQSLWSYDFLKGYDGCICDLELIIKEHKEEHLKENPPFSGPYD